MFLVDTASHESSNGSVGLLSRGRVGALYCSGVGWAGPRTLRKKVSILHNLQCCPFRMRSSSRRHEPMVAFYPRGTPCRRLQEIMHLRNKQDGATKNRVELEPGDEGRRASSAPLGLVPSTYDASTSLRRPRKTLTRFVAKGFFCT